MTHLERRQLRMEIAQAMQAPDADIHAVAREFEVNVKYVYTCCEEHEVPVPRLFSSKPGARPVNMFAVLKDLLAGATMETCAIKHKVSKARIGQIAKLAREGGWTELGQLAKKHRAWRKASKRPSAQ